jgi:hypothetical protein
MTEDELLNRTIAIIRDLSDLKEDVLHMKSRPPYVNTPDFDAGLLAAALAILMDNVSDNEPKIKAEIDRQCARRLQWVMNEIVCVECGKPIDADAHHTPSGHSFRV